MLLYLSNLIMLERKVAVVAVFASITPSDSAAHPRHLMLPNRRTKSLFTAYGAKATRCSSLNRDLADCWTWAYASVRSSLQKTCNVRWWKAGDTS